jgi:riboflavin kinase / FMN adenylyltransferase
MQVNPNTLCLKNPMKLFHTLEECKEIRDPVALTIGSFDGVHRGHQAILHRVRQVAAEQQGKAAVMTFENHPVTVLHPAQPMPFLCTLAHRINLLEQEKIDILMMLPFTKELSEQSAETFLKNVRINLPFHSLILGSDAVLGKDRQGDPRVIQDLAKTLGFQVEYLPNYSWEGMRVSSSKIRELIKEGALVEAEKLLGRKFSIVSRVTTGAGQGKKIGFPTANIDIEGLCLPPLGVYAVQVIYKGNILPGVANLGIAPTVRRDNKPVLEVHLFDFQEDFYGQPVEIIFIAYIRPEKKFENITQLTTQIAKDIQEAKTLTSLHKLGFK